MKCSSCGNEINVFRVVGVCDFNNFVAEDIEKSNSNIPLLVGSNFIPIAMLTCACGEIKLLSIAKAMEVGLSQDGHARGEIKAPLPKVNGHGR